MVHASMVRKPLRSLGSGALACLALVTLSVAFVDRPVAEAMHASGLAGGPWRGVLLAAQDLAQVPNVITAAAIVLLIATWPFRVNIPRWANVVILACIACLVADVLKEAGKLAFGRTWPETWIDANPSLIHDGVYGFFPFHGGERYASFPSGHMTVITAFTGSFAMLVRRAWVAAVTASAVVAIGLLGLDYHFVGDIVGGGFLGIGVAWAVVSSHRYVSANRAQVDRAGAAG